MVVTDKENSSNSRIVDSNTLSYLYSFSIQGTNAR